MQGVFPRSWYPATTVHVLLVQLMSCHEEAPARKNGTRQLEDVYPTACRCVWFNA